MSDLTGSQYLANLGPIPGESEDEHSANAWNNLSMDEDDESIQNSHMSEESDNYTMEEIDENEFRTKANQNDKKNDSTYKAYQYLEQEIIDLYLSNITVKQVIAGQPIRKGGSKCMEACYYRATVDHHIHTYCKTCKRNLFTGEVIHECKWGIESGEIHPEMDPHYLHNIPW